MQVGRIPKGEPYLMVAVCVCFVGKQSDVLLLQKRKDHPVYPNLWGFPAGKKNANERCLQQAACREIKEETGNIVPIDKLTVFDHRAYMHVRPDGKPFYFIARSFFLDNYVLPGFCLNDDEHKAALVVPAKDVPGMNTRHFIPDAHESFLGLYQRLQQLGKL